MIKLLTAIIMIGSLTLVGCKQKTLEEPNTKSTQSAYENIQKSLIEMESYVSKASVEYISNKNTNTYETIQHAKTNGKYRIEILSPSTVAGNITMSDGTNIYQYNPNISGKISTTTKENQERSEIFITNFLKNYLTSQEVSVSVGNFGEGQCTILEAILPGNHAYLAKQKLWVDNKTYKPVKLVIYDQDDSERIVVTYTDFEYNVKLDDNLFIIK
jgi:outer membrane lipoprotein-sorting protein